MIIKRETGKQGPRYQGPNYPGSLISNPPVPLIFFQKISNLPALIRTSHAYCVFHFVRVTRKTFVRKKYLLSKKHFQSKSKDSRSEYHVSPSLISILKAHRQISGKRCSEKYCSCDQAYQFSAS